MVKRAGLIIIFFLASTSLVSAAPSNGTRLLAMGEVEVGYEYNNMFRRDLALSYGILKTQDHFFIASVGLFDWLTLDGKAGIGDVMQKDTTHLPKLEYRDGFAGGYGFRVRFFDHPQTGVRIIAGLQHISVHPQDRSIDDDKYESFLDDWQVSAIATRRFTFFTPYVGMKLSDCEIVYNINKHDKKRRYSENHIGFLFGSDFWLFDDKVRVNAEARFFDETAFSTAIAYLF